ncbi:MAG: hypothetical protein AB7Q69_16165 [Gemmatimonadales bacterium]
MLRQILAITAVAAVVGCGRKDRTETATADSLVRDLQMAPAETTAALNDAPAAEPAQAQTQTAPAAKPQVQTPRPQPRPATQTPSQPAVQRPPVAAAPLMLAEGTSITGTVNDSINSRHDKAGKLVTVSIPADVKDENGRIVIPAGSVAHFTVTEIAPAENKSQQDGKLTLSLTGVTIGGQNYPVAGTSVSVQHEVKGRGVTAGDAAKVGAGAAVGAIAGRIVGGKRGTVVGGAVGAAVGTGAAIQTADRDVVVAPGAEIVFTLSQVLTVPR